MNRPWIESALAADPSGNCAEALDTLSDDELRSVAAYAGKLACELDMRMHARDCPVCAAMLAMDLGDDADDIVDDADVIALDDAQLASVARAFVDAAQAGHVGSVSDEMRALADLAAAPSPDVVTVPEGSAEKQRALERLSGEARARLADPFRFGIGRATA